MSEKQKRRGGGAKLSRTKTVTVRLDPQLQYMADLAARKQRRTLSSFIEWAIGEGIKHVKLLENGQQKTVYDEYYRLWDVDEADRFVKLATRYPELLTHEEQILWKLLRENSHFWAVVIDRPTAELTANYKESNCHFDRVREHWANLKLVARGEEDPSVLPEAPALVNYDD